LDAQLRWLAARGLRGVSMRELLDARADDGGAGLVGLTFDDGYADFPEHALPVLLRHGCTATVFPVAGRLGQDNAWEESGPSKPLMTVEQVAEVAAAGMEIASHGLRHVSLPEASGAALTEELEESRALLAEAAGAAVRGFCYPCGHVSSRVVEAVRAAGYDYGCAIWRCAYIGRHALPRIYVGEADNAARLWAKRVRHRVEELAATGPLGTRRAGPAAEQIAEVVTGRMEVGSYGRGHSSLPEASDAASSWSRWPVRPGATGGASRLWAERPSSITRQPDLPCAWCAICGSTSRTVVARDGKR
jgi:peptidoglycan/xylan/chitin deacetylase (PgdA/CDA1 family)